MKLLGELITNDFIFNHRVYDNAKDKEFAMHSHNQYELIYVFSGELEYVIENEKYLIKPDTLIVIKPFTYHYFTITSHYDYEKISVLFNENLIDAEIPFNNQATVISRPGEIIKNIFHKINYYYKSFNKSDFYNLIINLTKEVALNLKLISNSEETTLSNLPNYVSSALTYINENLFTLKNIDEIASKLYVSKTYLISLFKKHLKIAPKQYVTEKRLLHAKTLISLGKRPTDVYEQCGFSTYTSFFRSYKKYFGVTPSET